MDIPGESGAVGIAILAILTFLTLFVFEKQALSERQRTGIWLTFTVLFFSICNAFVHSAHLGAFATGQPIPPAVTAAR